MSESTRLEQFRLALSYLERVQGETAHWGKLRADKQLDRTKYDQVHARYTEHLSRATRIVDGFRRDAARDLPAAESVLASARADQKKLLRRATSGKVNAQKLNDRNRALTRAIVEHTARFDELRTIVDAKSTAELGGGIDFPLEEYPKRLEDLPPPPRFSPGRLTPLQGNLISGAVMLVLVLGSVGGIYLWRSAPRAVFTISLDELSNGFVGVECRNAGNRPLFLYVPWPNGRAEPLPGVSPPGSSFGVLLYVRMIDESQLRLYESPDGVWKLRGNYVDGSGPIEIRGGTAARLFLDLDRLRASGLELSAVAIECSKRGGADRVRKEIELPAA